MKYYKLLLCIGLGLMISMESCNSTMAVTNPNAICYICTHQSKPGCKVDVCDGAAIAINCGRGGLLDGNTNEEIRKNYLAAGYRCRRVK